MCVSSLVYEVCSFWLEMYSVHITHADVWYLCSFFADDNKMTNDKFTLASNTHTHILTPNEKKMYAQITAQPNLIITAHWTTTAATSTYEQYSPSQLRWWRAQHIIANIASFFLNIYMYFYYAQYIFLFILWENWNCCNKRKW